MKAVLSSFLSMLHAGLRSRASMHLEILALRHRLAVLHRRTNKRPSLRTADRWLWILLSRFWDQGRSALVIVKPETVIGWQRKRVSIVLALEEPGREVWSTLRQTMSLAERVRGALHRLVASGVPGPRHCIQRVLPAADSESIL
jgi:hypothetical protein